MLAGFSKEQIFQKLQGTLSQMFGVKVENITLASNLYKDLDIDSIDAIDLMVKLEEFTGKKPNPEQFKNIRTVDDLVNVLYDLTH